MKKSFNQSIQFIKSIVRYTWFKSPMIYKVSPIFEHAHPVIIEVTFSFLKFVSACKNHLISSIHFEIEQFQNLRDRAHFRPPPSKND